MQDWYHGPIQDAPLLLAEWSLIALQVVQHLTSQGAPPTGGYTTGQFSKTLLWTMRYPLVRQSLSERSEFGR